jgi:hypothetical protein
MLDNTSTIAFPFYTYLKIVLVGLSNNKTYGDK